MPALGDTGAPMPALATASVLICRAIVGGLQSKGVPPERLLAEVGLTSEELADPHFRVPHDRLLALWRGATRLSGDPSFGLSVGQQAPLGSFDVLDYVIRNCAVLGEAFEAIIRYQRLIHTATGFHLERAEGTARFTQRLVGEFAPMPREACEFVLAALVTRGRRVTGRDWSVRQVSFQHAAPDDTREYQRLFRGPVLFSQPVNELVLDEALLRLPTVGADPGLKEVLERHGVDLLSRLPPAEDFISKVRYEISVGMRGSPPSVDTVARKLGLSRRSLQRRLGEEGTRFQQLVDATRRSIAERQIRERKLALSEIAFLLGFSEASAFHRAFRRWTGLTPSEYLRQGGAVPA